MLQFLMDTLKISFYSGVFKISDRLKFPWMVAYVGSDMSMQSLPSIYT